MYKQCEQFGNVLSNPATDPAPFPTGPPSRGINPRLGRRLHVNHGAPDPLGTGGHVHPGNGRPPRAPHLARRPAAQLQSGRTEESWALWSARGQVRDVT